jgi:SAM-dependent methyltransferase
MPRRAAVDLFLVSFLILFFELAAIRWFGATVVFLSFFTNLVLLASFLGMSVGLLAARRSQALVLTTLPLLVLSLGAAIAVYLLYWRSPEIAVSLGDQGGSPQMIYFGTEYRPADPSKWFIPMWAVGGAFFALIALTFVGLGQVMGRAFDAIPNRVAAYTIDICGSLAGIGAFAAMSHFQLSPVLWFVLILLLTLRFAGWSSPVQLASTVAALVFAWIGAHGLLVQGAVLWSPYYKISYSPERLAISTNGISHQQMGDLRRNGIAYLLPYLLNRDAGGPPFEDVMIIGAGSGNDVAAALRSGAKRVDAVEIDPSIAAIGRALHPNRPYDDPRVAVYADDGRNFVRATARKYDLAVYAVVDSLVLHSGYSSLRLESFLFTREALADVKRVLKPGGVFVMYNYYRQGWVVGRLAEMAKEVFGTEPIVFSLPPQPRIAAGDNQSNHFTFILAGVDPRRLEALRAKFAENGVFWANAEPARSEGANGFRKAVEPGQGWVPLIPAQVDSRDIGPLPSDDWPQLYLRDREIPWSPIGEGLVMITVLSLLLLLAFAPAGSLRPNGRIFFLGAGFMLLESKAVVHMALLFGSTWIVNAVVFAAILVMIACANLYVLAARPRNLPPYYALLIAALLVNALVPMDLFLGLAPLERTLASCLVVFVPIFFAGVVFGIVFRESRTPDVDFGWNVAGIVLGGVSEQLSLVLGFSHLLLLAVAYYLLSLVLRPRYAGITAG